MLRASRTVAEIIDRIVLNWNGVRGPLMKAIPLLDIDLKVSFKRKYGNTGIVHLATSDGMGGRWVSRFSISYRLRVPEIRAKFDALNFGDVLRVQSGESLVWKGGAR